MLINTDSKTKKSILAAMTIAEYESLTTAEKTIIELSQYAEAEAYSILETAKMDAKQEGREEGALQKALETTRNLLSMNLPHVQIAQATGLTLELVQAVAKTDTNPTSKS